MPRKDRIPDEKKLRVIEAIITDKVTTKIAARRFDMTPRTIRRLVSAARCKSAT